MTDWHLSQAVRALRQGGVIAYPTEAVFGLGCDPANAGAVERILNLKQRSMAKGLILIAADVEQLQDWVYFPNGSIKQRVVASWPGPNTWILPCLPGVPGCLTGDHESLAVRVTNHPTAAKLCSRFGPLVSTSANLSGRKSARTPLQVRSQFATALDYILPGVVDRRMSASTIRDAWTNQQLR